jgi:hypothetical protein
VGVKFWTCCCGWSYVVGKRRVYGAIWPMGIGTYPDALNPSARMMMRAEWEDWYADCAACHTGAHHHDRASAAP